MRTGIPLMASMTMLPPPMLADRGVNICNFSLSRRQKGGVAVMTIEMDGGLDEALAARVRALPDVMLCVTLLP